MKSKTFKVLALISITSFIACSLNSKTDDSVKGTVNVLELTKDDQEIEPHRYGGWYCPDNLNGFPAVDIAKWKNVPVINGRMATKEETQSEASLIFVDAEKYPNAKPLDMKMPKLATYYNRNTAREDLIIVIQALNISNDSIVGFRFLNGGNGSARLNEIELIAEQEAGVVLASRFISFDVEINTNQNAVSKVLTDPKHSNTFQPIFDKNNSLTENWRKNSNINFHYSNTGKSTAAYANMLYGCFYVQNDYSNLNYTEKILLLEDEETQKTTMKISCGPYATDYEAQKVVLKNWAAKVKEISEQ